MARARGGSSWSRRLAAGVATAAVALGGWTGSASASAPGAHAAERLELDDVLELAERSAPSDGPGLNVLVEDPDSGDLSVERIGAAPDEAAELLEQVRAVDGVLSASVDRRVRVASDPLAPQQYNRTRIRANLLPSDVVGTGLTVAVVDTGVHGSHPDLVAPLSDTRPRVATGTTFLWGTGLTGAPGNVDPNGHGTHAAGVIAATRGNGIGIAGLAPDVQILPVRALDANGEGWSSDITSAVLWAHAEGADVINLSLAGPQTDTTLNNALAHVTTDTTRGKPATVVVAAAGNAGASSPTMWPAAHSSTIAVGASDASDLVASFSTRGSYLDLTAPGVSVPSTCVPSIHGSYCTMSGTSMAAPQVAAVVALLRSEAPSMTPAQVRTRLRSTAHDIATLGRDNASGWGRVDAAAAVLPATFAPVGRIFHQPTGSIGSVQVNGRQIVVRGTASDREGTPRVRVESTVSGRRSVRTFTANGGTYTAAWNDLAGTHRICVSVLDVPTNVPRSLGCREAVVK